MNAARAGKQRGGRAPVGVPLLSSSLVCSKLPRELQIYQENTIGRDSPDLFVQSVNFSFRANGETRPHFQNLQMASLMQALVNRHVQSIETSIDIFVSEFGPNLLALLHPSQQKHRKLRKYAILRSPCTADSR
jgi:hypothetical protein